MKRILAGGRTASEVVRIKNTVRRSVGPNSIFTHSLLKLLEERKFRGAPRFLGIDQKGREILSFMEGQVYHKETDWTDAQLVSVVRILKDFHDATTGSELTKGREVVCHNDIAPWNLVLKNGAPTAFIDFDDAAPGDRVDDLAYFLWTFLRLGSNVSADVQAERIRKLSEAYGSINRHKLIGAILEQQEKILAKRKALAKNAPNREAREFSASRIKVIRSEIAWVKMNRNVLEGIAPPALTRQFFEEYWGFKKVNVIKQLQLKGGRSVGIISVSTERYFFKVASIWKDEKGLKKDTAVFEALYKKKFYYAPRLIKTKNGKDFVKHQGRLVYLTEYILGTVPKRTVKTYQQLARVTAELHSIKGFPFETDFDPAIIAKGLSKNSKQWAFGGEYRKILKSFPNFSKLAQVVIHTDIGPTNSIQKKNGKIVFVDWDDAGIGPMALDLGGVLNEIIRENTSFKEEYIKAFYKTYFSKRKISKPEKRRIFDGCLFFALMYIVHGDLNKRWKRILWLTENRETIEALYM